MEIEELFCKRYPDYSVNGKPLHPYFDVFEEGYEQAENKLEEENKKLKEKLNFSTQYYQGEKAKDQLAKAKEIIKELIDLGKIWLSEEDDDYSFIERAEQFLKEVEK